MTAPQLDFYAPLPDHVKMHKEKLSRQREPMFSWRSNHNRTAFDPKTGARKPIVNRYELAPKQVLLPGSRREAEALKRQKQQNETIWDSTASSAPMGDRRREWKASGFAFEQEHFRTSSDPRSPYHPHNRPPVTAALLRERQRAISENPYRPYYHERILFSSPRVPAGTPEVTSLAVTCNTAEAVQRELHASRALRQAQMMGRGRGVGGVATGYSMAAPQRRSTLHKEDPVGLPTSMCEALGPTMASQQRQMDLIEAMYKDLIRRQGLLQGEEEMGAPASLKLDIPTSEIAYSLRPEYLEKHQLFTRTPGEGISRKSFVHTKRGEVARARQGGLAGSDTMVMVSDDGTVGPNADTQHPKKKTKRKNSQKHASVNRQHRGTSSARSQKKEGSTASISSSSSSRYGDTETQKSSTYGKTTRASGEDTMTPSHLLPTEAKGTRLYAIHLRRNFTREELNMVGRQDPIRHGVEVALPESWQTSSLTAWTLRA